MKSVIYQEVHKDTTYKLLGRDVGNIVIYDIEVEKASYENHTIETVCTVSTDCQTSMLLLELLIRKDISLNDLVRYSNAFLNAHYSMR
ncbi:MAG: hypothetical protein LIO71_08270 [Ruminococcus sp.]|nr:hypothetical protein [Ruminococcus sp.]